MRPRVRIASVNADSRSGFAVADALDDPSSGVRATTPAHPSQFATPRIRSDTVAEARAPGRPPRFALT
jgi:hypothetical protein